MQIQKIVGKDARTRKAGKNIILSFGVKGVDSIVQLLLVPVTLGYLNAYEYGIWLTLNSILLWVNSFDIGLGNGLRNQLAAAVALNDERQARSLVSTAFVMIAVVMMGIFLIGSFIVLNVDWYDLLGTTSTRVDNLLLIVYISFALFCVNFMVKFIGNIYLAMQMPSINNLMVMLGHLLSLVIIFLLTRFTDGSLFNVAVSFSLSPIIIYLAAYPITFYFVYRALRPSIRLFDAALLKGLFNIGLLFFFLQMFGIVLFSMSNIIISRYFGPEMVTPYNVSYRYFCLINMFIAITISPMWSAVTDANTKGDYLWIKHSIEKCRKILFFAFFLLMIMVAVSNYVYDAWVGFKIDYSISVLMAIYIYELSWSLCYSYFLNGLGLLKLQTVNTFVVAILFYPLCSLLAHEWQLHGVLICMILTNMSGCILNTWQLHKYIRNKI